MLRSEHYIWVDKKQTVMAQEFLFVSLMVLQRIMSTCVCVCTFFWPQNAPFSKYFGNLHLPHTPKVDIHDSKNTVCIILSGSGSVLKNIIRHLF